jgi:hypothetical protein
MFELRYEDPMEPPRCSSTVAMGASSRRDYVTGTLRSAGIADVDGDGKPDLPRPIRMTSPKGTTRCPCSTAATGASDKRTTRLEAPSSVAFGDLTGDGSPDLVVATNSVTVLVNGGDGSFGTGTTTPCSSPSSVALADLNGDDALDVVAADSATTPSRLSSTAVTAASRQRQLRSRQRSRISRPEI